MSTQLNELERFYIKMLHYIFYFQFICSALKPFAKLYCHLRQILLIPMEIQPLNSYLWIFGVGFFLLWDCVCRSIIYLHLWLNMNTKYHYISRMTDDDKSTKQHIFIKRYNGNALVYQYHYPNICLIFMLWIIHSCTVIPANA